MRQLWRGLVVDVWEGSGVWHLADVGRRGVEHALQEGAGRACWGLPMTCAGTPCSTITPWSMNTTRSATSRAKLISWATTRARAIATRCFGNRLNAGAVTALLVVRRPSARPRTAGWCLGLAVHHRRHRTLTASLLLPSSRAIEPGGSPWSA